MKVIFVTECALITSSAPGRALTTISSREDVHDAFYMFSKRAKSQLRKRFPFLANNDASVFCSVSAMDQLFESRFLVILCPSQAGNSWDGNVPPLNRDQDKVIERQ